MLHPISDKLHEIESCLDVPPSFRGSTHSYFNVMTRLDAIKFRLTETVGEKTAPILSAESTYKSYVRDNVCNGHRHASDSEANYRSGAVEMSQQRGISEKFINSIRALDAYRITETPFESLIEKIRTFVKSFRSLSKEYMDNQTNEGLSYYSKGTVDNVTKLITFPFTVYPSQYLLGLQVCFLCVVKDCVLQLEKLALGERSQEMKLSELKQHIQTVTTNEKNSLSEDIKIVALAEARVKSEADKLIYIHNTFFGSDDPIIFVRHNKEGRAVGNMVYLSFNIASNQVVQSDAFKNYLDTRLHIVL